MRKKSETAEMIESTDEMPWIRETCVQECAPNGVEVDLADVLNSRVGAPG